jgi:Fe-S oxidoreductase
MSTATTPLINIQIMGKPYAVPPGITLVQAMWHVGLTVTRGIGCLGGVCGACSTHYRTVGSYKLKSGLACQLIVEEGISFSLLQSFPVRKPIYHLDQITDPKQELFKHFPETAYCRNCNACTEACPQGIDVRAGIWKANFGDFKGSAEHFLPCVMCNLCVPVCIAEISSNQVGLYARRAQGVFFEEKSTELTTRINEIKMGKFESEWNRILSLSTEALKTVSLA